MDLFSLGLNGSGVAGSQIVRDWVEVTVLKGHVTSIPLDNDRLLVDIHGDESIGSYSRVILAFRPLSH